MVYTRRIPPKVRVPLKLHRQDLERIDKLLEERENRTEFIEEAFTLLFEQREQQIRRPMSTL